MKNVLLPIFSALVLAAPSFAVGQLPDSEPMLFDEIAVFAGVDAPGYGRGSAIVDLDNDGLLDIIVTTCGLADQFYRQKSNGTFQLMNSAWGIPNIRDQGWGVLAADFDNDGDKDVFFPTGGFYAAEVNGFLRNDLNVSGKFVDITATAGTSNTIVPNFGGTAIDYDKDGDLDIFLTSCQMAGGQNQTRPTCELYRNDGNLQFVNVTAQAGFIQRGDYRHCSSGDYDNDGWDDIIVGDFDGNVKLYHNNSDGTFTEVANLAGISTPFRSFGASFEDFNNDGWLDVFVPKYQFSNIGSSKLYLNRGDGTFLDYSSQSRMTAQDDMGHSTGDLNADGWPDIFIGTGNPSWERKDNFKVILPELGAAGDSGGVRSFPALREFGLDAMGNTRCHGVNFADVNNDGWLDLYVNNGGISQILSNWGYNGLFYARGNSLSWIKINPVSVFTNKDAVGVKMAIVNENNRTIWRRPTVGKGFSNTDPKEQHFGLGTSNFIRTAKIVWPSGIEQTYVNLETKTSHDILETGMVANGTPTLGGTVTLSVLGPRFATVELCSSLTPAYVEDPVEKVVHRLGGTIFSEGTYTIPGAGARNIIYNIPNDPALSGRSIYLQAKITDNSGVYPYTETQLIELPIP